MFPIRQTNTVEVLPSATAISNLLDHVTELLKTDLNKEFLASEAGDVVELARAFVSLRKLKDKLDEADKAFSKLFETAKVEKVPQKFEQAGVPSVTLDEGFRVGVSHLVRASVKTGKKELAVQWLKDNGMESVVSDTINASTLSAVARTRMEDGEELNEELFNTVIIPNTSVTKT